MKRIESCTVTIMRSSQTVRTIIRRISCAVVKRDVINVNSCAVADAEAMNGVVLNVNVVDGAVAEDLAELDEVIGPGRSISKMLTLLLIRQTHFATPPLLPSPSHHA